MSWLKDLYDTYQENLDFVGKYDERGRNPLLPLFHQLIPTQIHITLSEHGDFISADIDPLYETITPASEASMSRTSGAPAAHGLSDTMPYMAGDYFELVTGSKKRDEDKFKSFQETLTKWTASDNCPKLIPILKKYIDKKSLLKDLITHNNLLQEEGLIVGKWGKRKEEKPKIYSIGSIKPTDMSVRWSIIINKKALALWRNKELHDSWINLQLSTITKKGLCNITGATDVKITSPSRYVKAIRSNGDSSKLISTNDTSNFTYRGKFNYWKEAATDKAPHVDQVALVGIEANHSAHFCLKWLLKRQGYVEGGKDGSLAIVAWGIKNISITQPIEFSDFPEEEDLSVDTNEGYGRSVASKIRGYSTKTTTRNDITILAIDSPSDGRSSIVHYSKHTTSDYLEKLEYWHTNAAWAHGSSVKNKFIGAPSPLRIAEACFEKINKDKWEADPKVTRRTIKSFLPCIINQTPIPRHYLSTILKKVSNRDAYKKTDQIRWENSLSIACSLYKHHEFQNNNITYDMNLELKDKPRDYLYGCLLAIADHYEDGVLRKQATAGIAKDAKDAKTKRNTALNDRRPTNAARMMAAFSQKPYTTWLNLHRAVEPYLLKNQTTNHFFQEAVGAVITSFENDAQYKDNTPLEGTYLLGFYSQREALKPKEKNSTNENNGNN